MPTILIADDDAHLRSLLSQSLSKEGYRILEAHNGQNAIEVFQNNTPDIAILDVNMGEGLTGYDVCRGIRQDPYGISIPVIFLTGMAEEEDLVKGFQEGADDYIRKPFSMSELLIRVSAQASRLRRQSQRMAKFGEQQFRLGSTIEGANGVEYKITSRLSSGGMGVIFRGYRLSDQLQVAIKTINTSGMSAEEGDHKDLQRFLREANATLSIRHPNLASGVEIVRTLENCCYIMEFVEGKSLAEMIEQSRRIPQPRALDIVIQVTRGLIYLHQMQLVHRDIKPGNILVTSDNRAVLVDMGLAKPIGEKADLTTEGVILGTPYYLSPEQAMGDSLDIRSDIYNLGATFYHAITGIAPFRGASTMAIINARFIMDPQNPHDMLPEIHEEISEIINKMMARNIHERYQNPTELLRDLKKVQAHGGMPGGV